jgi:hypothetical protein
LALKHDWNITKEKLVWMTGKRILTATFKELQLLEKLNYTRIRNQSTEVMRAQSATTVDCYELR